MLCYIIVFNKYLQMKIEINIDDDLLKNTAQYFNLEPKKENYSKLIEEALHNYTKQRLNKLKNIDSDDWLYSLLEEPVININTIDHNYNFELSSVEGSWPGDEPVEYLISLLNE